MEDSKGVISSIKSFLKTIEGLFVILSLVFGGIVSTFTEIKSLFLKYPDLISIFTFSLFLFLALIIYLRKENKELNGKIKVRETDYLKIAEEIGTKIDFKFDEYEHEIKINLDGSSRKTRTIKLNIQRETLSSLDFQTMAFGDNNLINYKLDVQGQAVKSRVEKKLIHLNAKSVFFNVEFSPALQKNATANIGIIEEFDNGFYRMTQEEIIEMIKNNSWIVDQPYEMEILPIRYPIEKLTFRVILPKNYKISGDEFWDVVIGYSRSRAFEEYTRIKDENCFKFYEGDNMFEMIVNKPKISLGYCIKWKPPSKKEYERLLSLSKSLAVEI